LTTALIDADIVAYRAAAVSQENIDWQDGKTGPTLSKQQALSSAKFIVDDWTERADCNKAILCFTGANNFRREVFPEYKSNRKGDPPELLGQTIEWMKDNYESYSVHRLEADDLMSVFATSEYVKAAIIVSIDKDMQTVPAFVFNPDKDKRPRRIRVPQADRFWMTQVLTGDSTDGYKGIPGIGPKKAEKILEQTSSNLPDLWSTVVSAYLEAGLTESDALIQARVSRILRAEDYNADKKEIRLWHPMKPTTLSIDPLTTSVKPSRSTSSKREDSTSLKETSSSTSADGAKRAGRKTSTKRNSMSRRSSTKRAKTNTLSSA
jgi:DNA polymerase-1